MALEGPTTKEVKEAIKFIEELKKNPEKYERWLDSVIDKGLKGWRSTRAWKGTTKKPKRS